MSDSHVTNAIKAPLCVPKVLAIRSNEIQLQRFLALSKNKPFVQTICVVV